MTENLFSERFIKIFSNKQMSQTALARRLMVNKATINRWNTPGATIKPKRNNIISLLTCGFTRTEVNQLLEVAGYEKLSYPKPAGPPLVGRQRAWQKIQRIWDQISSRGGIQMVLISGETGIGKTRLADEVLQWAYNEGILNVHVDITIGYSAGDSVTAELLGKEPLSQSLRRLDEIWLAQIARLLNELFAEYPHLPRLGPLPAESESDENRNFFEALTQVFVKHRQMIIVLDNLQWCDQKTVEWLGYFVGKERPASVLIVGTVRSGEVGAKDLLLNWISQLKHQGKLEEIRLERLNVEETADLATEITGYKLKPDLAKKFNQITEGNPLAVVEYAKVLKEQGPQNFDRNAPPESVSEVILRRLRRLSEPAWELAKLVAITGRSFTWQTLKRAGRADEKTLAIGLDELCERFILQEQGNDSYTFVHDIYRQVAYNQIGTAQRRMLHGWVAQTLEANFKQDLKQNAGEIAFHYDRAGHVENAVKFYLLGARVSRQLGVYEEAISYLKQGLTLLEARPDIPAYIEQKLMPCLNSAPCKLSARAMPPPR